MRIAFVLPVNGISGGIYVAYQHAHFLASRGHDVTALFVSGKDGIQVQTFPGFSIKTDLLQSAVDGQIEYDVVFSTWWETFYEMFFLRSKRYFYFCQSDERRFYPSRMSFEVPFVEKTYCNNQIGIITEARWIKNWLEKDYNATVEYAPNGIDNGLFHSQVVPKEPKGKAIRVLIEGPGGIAYKRIDLAFKVTHRIPDIEVWYVTSQPVVQPHWKFEKMFTGVPLQEMPFIYRSCDILLKLSVVEGFFGPPLEMMACGGTAVVSQVTGYDEYVRHGENALAVPLDDEEGAYQALKRLVEDAGLRQKLSENGISTAKSMDWSRQCPLFEKAMDRLMERTPLLPIQVRNDYCVLGQLRKETPTMKSDLDHIKSQMEFTQNQLFNWRPFRMWKGVRDKLIGRRTR